jgi:hypothetical protein
MTAARACEEEVTARPVNGQPRGDEQKPRSVFCGLPLTQVGGMGRLTVDFSKLHGAEAAWVRQQFADLCGRVGASLEEDVEWFQPRCFDTVTGERVYDALLILTLGKLDDDELARLWEQVQADHQADVRRGAGHRKKRGL